MRTLGRIGIRRIQIEWASQLAHAFQICFFLSYIRATDEKLSETDAVKRKGRKFAVAFCVVSKFIRLVRKKTSIVLL